jgi:hypothetical protein
MSDVSYYWVPPPGKIMHKRKSYLASYSALQCNTHSGTTPQGAFNQGIPCQPFFLSWAKSKDLKRQP